MRYVLRSNLKVTDSEKPWELVNGVWMDGWMNPWIIRYDCLKH